MARRRSRGVPQLETRGNKLAVRMTYQGRQLRKSLGLPATPWGRYAAQSILSQIERDLGYGEFDPTFAKYLPKEETPATQLTTRQLWQAFIDHRLAMGTSGQAIASRYRPIAANLGRFKREITSHQVARDFIDLLRSRQTALIANQNLSLLKGWGDWAVEHGYWESNHFAGIAPLKAPHREAVRPFTREEIQAILTTAKTDPVAYRYHGFILTLLTLGLRPSEAIGLRWGHIDLTRGEVTICESLSRAPDGKTAGYARQRKSTKTGNARTLTLPQSVLTMLQGRLAETGNPAPDDLVFTSATGKPIDDRNFAQRVWRPLLAKAGVPYRRPYTCRHTLLSHLIERGASLPQAAYVAGHANTRMVSDTYGHMINRPPLPDW